MTIIKYDDAEESLKTETNKQEIGEKNPVHFNHKKKKVLRKKKLKHGVHEFYACTTLGPPKNAIRSKNCSRFDLPYVPSIKSMPNTSFSNATFVNLHTCKMSKPQHKCNKRILQKNIFCKDNLSKLSGEEHLSLEESKFINQTSSDLANKNNLSSLVVSSKSQNELVPEHSYSTNITNTREASHISESKTNSIMLCSQQSDSYMSNHLGIIISQQRVKQKKLHSTEEHSNTSTTISEDKTETHKLDMNKEDEILFEKIGENILKKETTLVLFDCNKYPLTDSRGKTLKTALGKSLVKYKLGKPYDCFGRAVYDSQGNSCLSPNFKPFSNLPKNQKIISTIALFDFRGYRLVNYNGSALKNAEGKDLIEVDKDGKILHDINKNPVFDKNGIPVTKQNGLWLLPKGLPLRLYDKTKHPLTNKLGEPLFNVKCMELLSSDEHGRPLIDSDGNPVFDASGLSAEDSKFNPSTEPSKSGIILIATLENKPARLFDKRGWPLTDKNGEVMNDAEGHCLIMLRKVYPNEVTDHDQLLFRLKDSVPLTDICLYLPETKLTSDDEEPNKKDNNEVKKKRKIVLDFIGHPLCDRLEGNVLDRNGRQIFLNIKSYFIGIDNNQCSKAVCISDGSTFTANTLNFSETKVFQRKEDDKLPFSEKVISFQTETDLFGRPLYDSSRRPLFDKYGRPIYDLFGRPIYNTKGQPIATADGKQLENGLVEPSGIDIGFSPSFLIPQDPKNLPKTTDLNGGPLFDSLGFPLYNQKGKPLIDAYGRPLYDENGIPQCDEEGRPTSKLVKQRNTPIDTVEDKIEILQLSPFDNIINPKTDELNSQITTSQETAESLDNEHLNIIKCFISRIRITTFTDGRKFFEILESVPFP